MELDFKNIFIASLVFGTKELTRIVFAKDKEDVVITLNDYYDNPQTGFIISYQQINELIDLSKSRTDKIFILVIEMVKEPNRNVFFEHIEWVDSISEVHSKYENRDCLFCDKDFILGLLVESDQMLKEPQLQPLISENISI